MMSKSITYKKGELIALSTGDYAAYNVNELVRALKDFNASHLLDEWSKENAVLTDDGVYRGKEGAISFVGYLGKNGYTEVVNYRELHTGDYEDTELTEY